MVRFLKLGTTICGSKRSLTNINNYLRVAHYVGKSNYIKLYKAFILQNMLYAFCAVRDKLCFVPHVMQ